MPNVPVTWLEQFSVTQMSGSTDPDIIQLSNGNILVAWSTTDDTAPGDSFGEDIIGQIFDSLGAPVGGPIRLNDFVMDNENNADLVATPDGGFIMVYEDNDVGGGTNLRLRAFDANGVETDFGAIITDAAAGAPFYGNPHIAVSSATSALIVYEENTGAGTHIVGKIYNPTTETFSAQFDLIIGAGGNTDPDITVLSNGNYVVTSTNNDAGDNRIVYRIVNSAGGNVLAETAVSGTDGDGFSDTQSSVTALAGGGFVITFSDTDTNDTDVAYIVYSNAGVEIASGTAGSNAGSTTNNNNEPVVSGLADGTFVIVIDNDVDDRMEVTHVSAAGTVLGTFNFSGPGSEPSITDLGDGRFAVAWCAISGGIQMEILDTRDVVNATPMYTPIDQQIGTVGNDFFTANGGAAEVFGHTGDDVITEAGGTKSYFGGTGNDTLIVKSVVNSDLHDGGSGIDPIDWSGSGENGLSFNLALGTVSDGANSEAMTGFENLTATNGNDTIVGTDGANILSGLGGNDTLNGGMGADQMAGGLGDDTYVVDNVSDVVTEAAGAGTDTVVSSVSSTLTADVENLVLTGLAAINGTGNALNNVITGNGAANVIDGGAGADQMIGGGGDDTYMVDNAGDVVTEGAGAGTDSVQSSASFMLSADVENLTLTGSGAIDGTGNALNNVLTGNDGANQLFGGLGNDTLLGGLGNDRLSGGLGMDILNGGAGADVFDFDTKFDSKKGVERDTVFFSHAEGDMIDLSTMDAATGRGNRGNQAFDWVDEDKLGAKFTGEAGELRFKKGILSGDINGDGKADFEIKIVGKLMVDDLIF